VLYTIRSNKEDFMEIALIILLKLHSFIDCFEQYTKTHMYRKIFYGVKKPVFFHNTCNRYDKIYINILHHFNKSALYRDYHSKSNSKYNKKCKLTSDISMTR
jgi:hypothetical protein